MMRPQPEAAWPSDAELRARLEDAFERFAALSDVLLGLLARGLGRPQAHFLDQVGDPASVLRVVHYPAPAGPVAAPQRCEVHTDYGTVSTLLIDDAANPFEPNQVDGTPPVTTYRHW